MVQAGLAESRLIEIYKLVAKSHHREALNKAELLVRDYPTIQGFVIVIGLLYVCVNLLVDLAYGLVDPRVRVH